MRRVAFSVDCQKQGVGGLTVDGKSQEENPPSLVHGDRRADVASPAGDHEAPSGEDPPLFRVQGNHHEAEFVAASAHVDQNEDPVTGELDTADRCREPRFGRETRMP
jgi:hypothetical protein